VSIFEVQNSQQALIRLDSMLKVTQPNGSEVTLRTMILDMQTRYQKLQADTIPVARDLSTAANVQIVCAV